jgi:hypothetical protein
MKRPNKESEGGPGQYLWMRNLTGADLPQERWLKADPGTGSGLGPNLSTISITFLTSWMKTKIGGQYLQMIRITPLTKTKKPYLKNPNTERGGGPGPYLWARSLRGGDHRLEKWMKADPGTGSGLGQNLWMINVACLGNWTRIEIEDQGIVIKDTPDQDLRKIGTGLMSERMEANMKSQNIMIKKVTGQSLMKGSTILKVNLVKIEIRSQSIVIEVIEGVPGQYHQKVSMTKEALHHIETRTILNTKDSGQNLLMPSITATMIMKIKMKDQSIKRNPCLN